MNEVNADLSPGIDAENLVKKFEGCRLTAYKDPVGIWTIGYGSTKGVTPGMAITQQEADDRMYTALQDVWGSVYALVNVPIKQAQCDALCDFAYNLGGARLADSTLLSLLNDGNFQDAANEFGHWVHAGGHVLQGLVARREEEKTLFLSDLPDIVNV